MNKCTKCNGDMVGDGYSTVMRCEYAEEDSYAYHAPDAIPVMCDYKEE